MPMMNCIVHCATFLVLVFLCISDALRIDSLVRTIKPSVVAEIPGDCRRADCILRPKTESLLNCSKRRSPRELTRLQMATDVCMPPLMTGSAKKLVKHKDLVEGTLSNGLAYKILPNSVPNGRFEAHLEVLSGSAHELENQQGMAHLLEHVAYMGSPKRQLISGTGSRTNAYTDFHHTVFFAACPTQTPDQFWKRPMMPMALDALLDVMTCTVDDDRLEKERAAVLSEASMVNKMEYRVECQILSVLHSENRISRRFPIGKEHLIRLWKKEDVQLYHSTHYRPDNVVLFIVGDVDVQETIDQIRTKFGGLRPKVDAAKLLRESGEFPAVSMRDAYRHYPPVTHVWSCGPEEAAALLPAPLVHTKAQVEAALPSADVVSSDASVTAAQPLHLPTPPPAPTLRLFTHELLKSFSFHLFAKRPIEPVTTEAALRRDIMRRITLSALQIRLNVQQRQDPLFTFVDFNQLNWPREGCAVCSLDMTADTGSWREAVKLAVREIRRMGLYGLTESELQRYKQASLGEAMQGAAQASQKGHEDVLAELMEAEASGHAYIHPADRLAYTEAFLREISLEEVNCVARQLCAHLSHPDPARGVQPAAIIASAPVADRAGNPVAISERDIAEVIDEALAEPLEPLEDATVPNTLLSVEHMQTKARLQPPAFVPLKTLKAKRTAAAVSVPAFGGLFGGSARPGGDSPTLRGGEETQQDGAQLGVVQRQLSNGLRVSLKELDSEPQKIHLRLYVPGGRLVESADNAGAVLLGARTIQEGGAFLNMTREEVELFCIDRQVMVEITASDEALAFDFQSVTTSPEINGVTGAEAVLQVAHIILTDFKYEPDAFERARQSLHEQYDSSVRGLETACTEELARSLTNGDTRFLSPNHEELEALDVEACRDAILTQLDPRNVECAICGDLPLSEMERLALTYLGTVPPRSGAKLTGVPAALSAITGLATEHQQRLSTRSALPVQTRGASRPLTVFFQDSEERATGYLAGPAPNKFGVFADGQTIADHYMKTTGKQDPGKWRDPLFCHVALQILQEIANRRLFSVVREERKLTYDASFQLQSREVFRGSWYIVSVTSSPAQVSAALLACQEALTSLKGSFGVNGDAIQSCKRTLLNKFHTDGVTNKFWAENLCGTLSEAVPDKTLRCIADYEQVLSTVAAPDIQYLVDLFRFEEDNMTACVGVTGAEPPKEN